MDNGCMNPHQTYRQWMHESALMGFFLSQIAGLEIFSKEILTKFTLMSMMAIRCFELSKWCQLKKIFMYRYRYMESMYHKPEGCNL